MLSLYEFQAKPITLLFAKVPANQKMKISSCRAPLLGVLLPERLRTLEAGGGRGAGGGRCMCVCVPPPETGLLAFRLFLMLPFLQMSHPCSAQPPAPQPVL